MRPNLLQAALLGGAFIGILSALPIVSAGNLCCCLWVVTGGALAAYIAQQNHPAPITPGDGALVGVLAGILGAVVYLVVALPVTLVMGPLERRMLERFLASAEDLPIDMRQMIDNMNGGLTGIALGFLFYLFAGVIFSTMGGLLGAVLFKRGTPPDAAPPAPPPLP
jgi:hypothetical protein